MVNLYRGMSKLKLKIHVNLCLLNKIDERSRIDKMSLHDIKVSWGETVWSLGCLRCQYYGCVCKKMFDCEVFQAFRRTQCVNEPQQQDRNQLVFRPISCSCSFERHISSQCQCHWRPLLPLLIWRHDNFFTSQMRLELYFKTPFSQADTWKKFNLCLSWCLDVWAVCSRS